jgi:hypothetical protein
VGTEILVTAALAVLTVLAAAGWWLMTWRPRQWALWVERENDFWRSKGLISANGVEKLKRLEKGRELKWLAGLTAAVGVVGLSLTLSVLGRQASLEHQKPRMPYDPVLMPRPASQPKPQPH